MKCWPILLALLAAGVHIPLCLAQNSTVVAIEVKDPTGLALPEAEISIVAPPQKQTAATVLRADSQGTVSLNLAPGTYELSVKSKGFRTVTKQVVVTNANRQTFTITLPVGGCPPGPCIEVMPAYIPATGAYPKLPDETAYEVYRAILGQPCEQMSAGRDWENWGCDVQNAKPLLIRADTVSPYNVTTSRCAKLESAPDTAVTLAVANWKTVNDTKWLLEDNFVLPMAHKIISSGELKETFDQTPGCKASLSTPFGAGCAWESFAEKFPKAGGWVELSAVGFNPERNVAVAYIAHQCGPLCGRGFVQVLRKKDGAWTPVKAATKGCGWMS